MRLPASTIVMAVLASVPFGLALRETARTTAVETTAPGSGDEDDTAADEARGRAMSVERDRAELARYETERRIALEAALGRALGDEPGTLGPTFAGFAIGESPAGLERRFATVTAEAARVGLEVSFDVTAVALDAIRLGMKSSYGQCPLFGPLANRWGGDGPVWLDAAHHQRARLDSDACRLVFERYDELDRWFAKLPLASIGAPASKLARPAGAMVDGSLVAWSAPGLGRGKNGTMVEATLERGVVRRVVVRGDTDDATADDLRNLLSARLGVAPKQSDVEDGSRISSWKGKPAVELTRGVDGVFTLAIGSPE